MTTKEKEYNEYLQMSLKAYLGIEVTKDLNVQQEINKAKMRIKIEQKLIERLQKLKGNNKAITHLKFIN